VRWKAADIAGLVELREGVPVIAERRRVERNPKVQRTLDFILPRLGDAHTLEERDGELFLTVRRLGRMKTERVSKARIRRRGLPTIVEEWRQELESSVVRIKYLP